MTLQYVGNPISMEQIRVENGGSQPISLYDHRRGGLTSLNNTGLAGVAVGVPDSHVGLSLYHFFGLHKVVDGYADWGDSGSWGFTIPQHGYFEFWATGAGAGGAVGRRDGTTGDSGGTGGSSQISATTYDYNGTPVTTSVLAGGGRAGSQTGTGGYGPNAPMNFTGFFDMASLEYGMDGADASSAQGQGGRGGRCYGFDFPGMGRYSIGEYGDGATTGTGGSGSNWGGGGGGTRGGGGGSGACTTKLGGYNRWRNYCPPFYAAISNGARGSRGSNSFANAGQGGAAYARITWKAVRPY